MRRLSFAGLPLAVALGALLTAGCTTPATAVSPPRTVLTTAFRLHYSTASKPVVVILGATGRSLDDVVQQQNQDTYAEQQGYVAAYVQAPNATHMWWTGVNSSNVAPEDDVAYLVQEVNVIRTLVPIDAHRVYVEGWSNGGFMAVHAVTTAPDVFKAAGEIESVLDLPSATTVPVRVKHIHSVNDTVVPIAGGDSQQLHGVFGRPVALPSSYAEASTLPAGSTWSLVTTVGSGAGFHDYQPSAAATFWAFFKGGP